MTRPRGVYTSAVKKSAAASVFQMAAEELRPRRLPSPFRCGLDSVGSEHSLHRAEGHFVTNARERVLDSPIAPTRIVARPPDNEFLELVPHAWSPGSLRVERPLPSDPLAVRWSSVTGVTIVATSGSSFRPSFLPLTAGCPRWSPVSRSRLFPTCCRWMRLSSRRNSTAPCCFSFNQPAKDDNQEREGRQNRLHDHRKRLRKCLRSNAVGVV